ncbi:hypothetical protein QQ045_008026 [Rhodiola kirilowii]
MPSPNLQTLPDDLIVEIFSWLPASSVVKFRYLNKSCNSLIENKRFVILHLRRTVENINETRRWRVLMLRRGGKSVSCIKVDGLDKLRSQVGHMVVDRSICEVVPMKLDFCSDEVIGSCNGLFCNYSYKLKKFMVWNPSTGVREYVDDCYHPTYWNWWSVVGFGNENDGSATDGFKIVRLTWAKRNNSNEEYYAPHIAVEVRIFTLGGRGWRNSVVMVPMMHLLWDGLYFKGALHWVDTHPSMPAAGVKRGIVVFSLRKEKFEQIMPLPECDDDIKLRHFQLTVMCGRLAVFYCSPFWSNSSTFEIWVMERYGVKESWTKQVTITGLESKIYMEPISFLSNGSLLLNINNQRTAIYDPKGETCNNIESLSSLLPSCGVPSGIEYIETLVPPICEAEWQMVKDAPKEC